MKGELLDELQQARADKIAVAVLTRLADNAQCLVYIDRVTEYGLSADDAPVEDVRSMLRGARSGMLADDAYFLRSYVPPYRLIIVGAVHIAQSLSAIAAQCGYQVTIVDPRRAFATSERFPADELCSEWPDDAMARLAPDAQTAVVTLAHDPKIDDPALIAALDSEAFYIGALGSRRTHEKRIQRLTEEGLGDRLERINAPIGLKLGGRAHSEIAVSILAQLIQARYSG